MSESPLHDPLGRSRTEIKVEVTVAALSYVWQHAGCLCYLQRFQAPQGDLHVYS